MVEPLDPDTLARLVWLQTSGEATDYDFSVWVLDNADTIEAVARDHARLTAANARLTAALDRICWDIEGDDHVEIARAALSAEAGDTDGD
jgi:hypothetical protein